MAGSHYPDYYLKKRRRETAYRRIVAFTVGIALFAILGIGAGYFVWKVWFNGGETVNPAQQREALKTETRLANAPILAEQAREPAANRGSAADVGQSADLSEIEYGQSIAATKVSITGSNQPASVVPPAGDEAATAEGGATAGGSPTPPESQTASDAFKRNDTPAPDSAESTAKPDKKPEETTSPAEKPAEKKPEVKPAESSGSTGSGSGDGGLVCFVYAGACRTKDEAEKMKSNLAALGFQSSIIESRVDFLVRVTSLAEVDAAEALVNKLKDSGFANAFATRSRK